MYSLYKDHEGKKTFKAKCPYDEDSHITQLMRVKK